MTRILAIADEVDEIVESGGLKHAAPDIVVSCGDLPFDYLERLLTTYNVPVLYVPGNHDPDVRGRPLDREIIAALSGGFVKSWDRPPPGPPGCQNLDGRIVEVSSLRVCGLGGSIRYSEGPNQYTDAQMMRRSMSVAAAALLKRPIGSRKVDVLVTHAPPAGLGDGDDPPHRGFRALRALMKVLKPKVLIHGHIHPFGRPPPDHTAGATTVVNAVGHRLVEV